MKRSALLPLLLSAAAVLNGCGAKDTANSPAETAPETKVTAAATSAEPSETVTSAATSYPSVRNPQANATAAPRRDYEHGEDGYFNLLEEYPEIKTEPQEGGTCWLFSAVNCMETSYAMKNGKYIDIAPMELLDIIYSRDKDEGIIPDGSANAISMGGWPWLVTETLSNGFGGLTLDGTVIIDPDDRAAIKENLHTRGSVSVGVDDVHRNYRGFHGKYYTLNYTEGDFDHNVTIVGYDDHFPRDYFNIPAAEDGAWIAYNSAMSDMLYYISYCAPLEDAHCHSVSDKYSAVTGYDAGNEQDYHIRTGEATTTANVFDRKGTLAAVGTYNTFDEQAVTVEIYDSSFKELLYSREAYLGYHGYHTIELDEPVEVDGCAVTVTYTKGAPAEGESIDLGSVDYVTKAEKGVSFVKLGGKWRDLTEEGIETELGTDRRPGNCCIKALYR